MLAVPIVHQDTVSYACYWYHGTILVDLLLNVYWRYHGTILMDLLLNVYWRYHVTILVDLLLNVYWRYHGTIMVDLLLNVTLVQWWSAWFHMIMCTLVSELL